METAKQNFRRFVRFLRRPEVVLFQLRAFLRIIIASFSSIELSQIPCGCDSQRIISFNNQTSPRNKTIKVYPFAGRRRLAITNDEPPLAPLVNHTPLDEPRPYGGQNKLQLAFKLLRIFRMFSTSWMAYVVIRYNLMDRIGSIANELISLEMPIRCYLVGSYVIHETMNEITAAILSGTHILWRAYQTVVKPYNLSIMYFLQLQEDDLAMFYASLDANQSIELTISAGSQLCAKQSFLLNLMCYKISSKTKVIYRLRQNRSRSAQVELARYTSKLTLVASAVFLSLATILISLITALILLDDRYLRLYGQCDPELQQLKRDGMLDWFSITITPHRLYAGIGDGLENIVLWVEGGLICIVGPCSVSLINYDLILCWSGISKKIELLASLMQSESLQRTVVVSRRSIIGRPEGAQSVINELFAEINDFFSQVRAADEIISTFLDGAFVGWAILCGIYSYIIQVNSMGELPLNIALLMTFFVVGISMPCFSLLKLHEICMSSYPKLCTMMAHDPMKHQHNYGVIMEYYNRRRSCFTIMGQFQFGPTTFLTVIGWTCSCFCIISGMLRDHERSSYQAKGTCTLDC